MNKITTLAKWLLICCSIFFQFFYHFQQEKMLMVFWILLSQIDSKDAEKIWAFFSIFLPSFTSNYWLLHLVSVRPERTSDFEFWTRWNNGGSIRLHCNYRSQISHQLDRDLIIVQIENLSKIIAAELTVICHLICSIQFKLSLWH